MTEAEPIEIEVVRDGLVESVHRARAVVTGSTGEVELAAGPVERPMFPRSSSKPLQVIGMLRHGLDLTGELLALAAASHSGEMFHTAGVERMLSQVGLGVDALQNIRDWPLADDAKVDWIRAGQAPATVAMNCSGKHAAMLRTCVINGWPLDSYRDPGHPLQRGITEAIADLTGETPGKATIDGCGAPLIPLSLTGLARAFGRVAAASGGEQRLLADAIRQHPEWVSGTHRDEAQLIRGFPGLIAKAGAEAVHAVGLPDGRGIAIKIDDGGIRARPIVMAAILQQLGYQHPVLAEHRTAAVLGGGQPVGEVRVSGRLFGR